MPSMLTGLLKYVKRGFYKQRYSVIIGIAISTRYLYEIRLPIFLVYCSKFRAESEQHRADKIFYKTPQNPAQNRADCSIPLHEMGQI